MQNVIIVVLLSILCLLRCNEKNNYLELDLGTTLSSNLSSRELGRLKISIDSTLIGYPEAHRRLLNFECGGGSGCYDLGFLYMQVLNKANDYTVSNLLKSLSLEEIDLSLRMIEVGLNYGDISAVDTAKIYLIRKRLNELKPLEIINEDDLGLVLSIDSSASVLGDSLILNVQIKNKSDRAFSVIYNYGQGMHNPYFTEVFIYDFDSNDSAIEVGDVSLFDSRAYSSSDLEVYKIKIEPKSAIYKKLNVYDKIYIGNGLRKLKSGVYYAKIKYYGVESNEIVFEI